MEAEKIKCPKCNSVNIRKGASYASRKLEGMPADKTPESKTANYCLDCENQWFIN